MQSISSDYKINEGNVSQSVKGGKHSLLFFFFFILQEANILPINEC